MAYGYKLYKNHLKLTGIDNNLEWTDLMVQLFGVKHQQFTVLWKGLTEEQKTEAKKYLVNIPTKLITNYLTEEQLAAKGKLNLVENIQVNLRPVLSIVGELKAKEFSIAEGHDIAGAAKLAGLESIPALVLYRSTLEERKLQEEVIAEEEVKEEVIEEQEEIKEEDMGGQEEIISWKNEVPFTVLKLKDEDAKDVKEEIKKEEIKKDIKNGVKIEVKESEDPDRSEAFFARLKKRGRRKY